MRRYSVIPDSSPIQQLRFYAKWMLTENSTQILSSIVSADKTIDTHFLHQRKLIGWSTTKVGKLVLPSRNISLLFSLLSITFIHPPLSLSLSLSSKTKSIANLSQYHSFPPPLTICMFVFLSTNSSVRRSLT